jgi:hypothetical protein
LTETPCHYYPAAPSQLRQAFKSIPYVLKSRERTSLPILSASFPDSSQGSFSNTDPLRQEDGYPGSGRVNRPKRRC